MLLTRAAPWMEQKVQITKQKLTFESPRFLHLSKPLLTTSASTALVLFANEHHRLPNYTTSALKEAVTEAKALFSDLRKRWGSVSAGFNVMLQLKGDNRYERAEYGSFSEKDITAHVLKTRISKQDWLQALEQSYQCLIEITHSQLTAATRCVLPYCLFQSMCSYVLKQVLTLRGCVRVPACSPAAEEA
jgi:hypothetical protein